MIEKVLYDYLKETTDTPVFLEIPASPPDAFILLEKTGETASDHIWAATVAVQTYAKTLYNAAALNETVKTLMFGAVRLPNVSKVDLNSAYNYTDPNTKHYRYQAVFDIAYMMEV